MGIRSFQDLDVYKRLREAMVIVAKEVLPSLPKEEKFGLIDQMRRASKAPLAIIAEGYAKKNYKKDWMKYINDAIGECNEMIAHLSCCEDIYDRDINKGVIKKLIDEYDISGKQLYRLGESWRVNE
ncbi:MAG: four helix bundle protein [Candidatus Omnitrophota bacterium]|jgi:four helix bundle protein